LFNEIPLWIDELLPLLALAIPIMINCILNITMQTVDLIFVGHLNSSDELAACALANSFFALMTFPLNGFLTALDTLLSQSFGARAFKDFGDYFQTALFCVNVGLVILSCVLWHGETIFLAMGQDENVSIMAGNFTRRLLAGIWPFAMSMCAMKYLNARGVAQPVACINFVANILNVVFNWLLIHKLGWGITGSPYATSLSRWLQFLLVCGLLWQTRHSHMETWPSFDLGICLELWRGFIMIALPGAAMMLVPTLSYEISTLLSGLLSVQEMGANSVMINFNAVLFMGSLFGLVVAGSIRVGHVLGSGLPPEDVKRTAWVQGIFTTLALCGVAVLPLHFKRQVALAFTENETIVTLIGQTLPVAMLLLAFNAPALAFQAVMLAMGMQSTAFWVNLVGFWVVGLPLSAYLTFRLDWGIPGLWWGLLAGMVVMLLCNATIVATLPSWERREFNLSAANSTASLLGLELEMGAAREPAGRLSQQVPQEQEHMHMQSEAQGERRPLLLQNKPSASAVPVSVPVPASPSSTTGESLTHTRMTRLERMNSFADAEGGTLDHPSHLNSSPVVVSYPSPQINKDWSPTAREQERRSQV
jgi:MATE family multidrug resistance protein